MESPPRTGLVSALGATDGYDSFIIGRRRIANWLFVMKRGEVPVAAP
jgi:hypothetical protein